MLKLKFTELHKTNCLLDCLIEQEIKGISNSGLYIWGFESLSKKFSPYYVGMTCDNLGNRLKNELVRKILNKNGGSNNMWRVTLHKDPEEELIFKRVARPGEKIKEENYNKLVYYNNADFMYKKYSVTLGEISRAPKSGFENWEQDFCKKNNGISKLINRIIEKLTYDSLKDELKELMNTYRKYILDDLKDKRKISDRLVFTIADLEEKKDQATMENWETILKYSLIKNVGSKSKAPPKNQVEKDKMEGLISFDGPDEIGNLFHNSKQRDFDRLYTWRR